MPAFINERCLEVVMMMDLFHNIIIHSLIPPDSLRITIKKLLEELTKRSLLLNIVASSCIDDQSRIEVEDSPPCIATSTITLEGCTILQKLCCIEYYTIFYFVKSFHFLFSACCLFELVPSLQLNALDQ